MKNPVYNALLAELYICGIATTMFYGEHLFGEQEDNIMMPIAMLSLLVLSVSIMGYLFCYTPLSLFLEGKKEEALQFFVKTVGTFSVITIIAFAGILFLGQI